MKKKIFVSSSVCHFHEFSLCSIERTLRRCVFLLWLGAFNPLRSRIFPQLSKNTAAEEKAKLKTMKWKIITGTRRTRSSLLQLLCQCKCVFAINFYCKQSVSINFTAMCGFKSKTALAFSPSHPVHKHTHAHTLSAPYGPLNWFMTFGVGHKMLFRNVAQFAFDDVVFRP